MSKTMRALMEAVQPSGEMAVIKIIADALKQAGYRATVFPMMPNMIHIEAPDRSRYNMAIHQEDHDPSEDEGDDVPGDEGEDADPFDDY